MAGLSVRERRTLLLLGVLYAAAVIPIGVHKGGDFTQALRQSERLLHQIPLYVENPTGGVWWPPFSALALVPFAFVARWSLAVAKASWAVLNVACVGWSVTQARRWTQGWLPVVIAVGAVAKPLQSNFEHLNITPLLLALVVQAAADLESHRDVRAGAWIGLAGAIKGFPALILLSFLVQRRWRGLAAGLGVGAGLTVGTVLVYGPSGAVSTLRTWIELDRQGAALGKLGTQSVPGLAYFFGSPASVVAALVVLCLGAFWLALRPTPRRGDAIADVGLGALVAVLCSPIAWLYYYTLAFPAWVGVVAQRTSRSAVTTGLFVCAGILTSGILTFGLYPAFLWFIGNPNYLWGGLLLFALLVIERVRRGSAAAGEPGPLAPVPRVAL